MTYLAVAVVAIATHEVDPVAVLVPEGPLVGQRAVGDGDVVVVVVRGERTAVMVDHGVTWGQEVDRGGQEVDRVDRNWTEGSKESLQRQGTVSDPFE